MFRVLGDTKLTLNETFTMLAEIANLLNERPIGLKPIGDVCMLKDANAYRGEWRICMVTNVFPDDNGKVRNVEVMVKPKQSGVGPYVAAKPIRMIRHVCNLIVVVPVEDERDLRSHPRVQSVPGNGVQLDHVVGH